MKDPAFLFYSKDWLTDTAEYMPNEKGVYIDLLCYQHQNGSLPADINRLSKMVGISTDEFEKIWSVISKHFEPIGQPNGQPNGSRMVNRKLSKVMGERSEKGKMNTITGTFAAMLRTGKYDEKTYKYLKLSFNASDFMIYEKEYITERLTEWLYNRLKSIGNENGNENEDVIKDDIENGKKPKFDFKKSLISLNVDEDIASDWMVVRRQKKAANTETAFNAIKTQIELSGIPANECIKEAVARSWQGFKAEWINNQKNNQNGTQFTKASSSNGFSRPGYDPNNGIGDGTRLSDKKRPTIFSSESLRDMPTVPADGK